MVLNLPRGARNAENPVAPSTTRRDTTGAIRESSMTRPFRALHPLCIVVAVDVDGVERAID
jgi:hypothetical protein